ncbi:MAG: amidase [Fimbriimonas ginsengisoli]|uniref:Amidase n=1 Tax=Fimbriimonas ginsengisoli TaxID=1005039 RepID=A0A931LTE4_FIMGI|nr:amidase [Fimbriimonas ginsengisoli]
MSVNHYSSIRDLGAALRSRAVSSKELARMYLGRLASLGKEHNAVAELTEGLAMKQAEAADKRLADGRSLGPLDGIPFGVKDLLATKGIPTRWGSPGHFDQVFPEDATAVARLQDAGGVLVAKLAMIELAGGGNYNVAAASATGPCLSAFDKTRWAGGSSSGSGAATALGCVGYSLGSETSGSITCPSAFNGLTGFRGTYGRVSRYGAMALCWTLDKIGPMGRSAEDVATVLQTIAGPDPKDSSTLTEPLRLRPRGGKPKIGLLKEEWEKNKATDCKKAYDETLKVLHKMGYETVDVAYPDLPYGTAIGIIVDAEGSSAHENFIRGDRFQMLADVNQVAGFAAALETRAVDYLWAMRFRQQEGIRANEVWAKCDAIFTPVFYHGAPSASEPLDKGFELMGGDDGPSNLHGWPALAFPIGFEGAWPLGGQILAPVMREDSCYRIVRDYQRETDWHMKRPAP